MNALSFFLFPHLLSSCEVIRDWKTGESLCYAFIEFEKVSHSIAILNLYFLLLLFYGVKKCENVENFFWSVRLGN